ncbi:MAG: hypothetical protein WDZ94_01730 [Patescibacteria group bacterium]
MIEKMSGFWKFTKNALFFLGTPPDDISDGWKFRRSLIYGGYRLSVAMIIFGALTFLWDTDVSATLVVSGTSMISIIITAYVAGATYDDNKNRKEP